MPSKQNEGYPFHFLGRFKPDGRELFRYVFVSTYTNKKYIVEFEVFPNELYGMKFYLNDYKKSKKRFKMLTNFGEARPVFRTLVAIGVDFAERMPMCSIVFVGENKVGEDKCNTQRYRIYKMLVANTISDMLFTHVVLDEQSAYLLVNKQVPDTDRYLLWVKEYMVATYSDFSE